MTNTHGDGSILAVIQMINKMEFDGEVGKFDDEDVQVMETFATFVASKLEGSSLLSTAETRQSHNEASMAFGANLSPKQDDSAMKFDKRKSSHMEKSSFQECDEDDF